MDSKEDSELMKAFDDHEEDKIRAHASRLDITTLPEQLTLF